MILTTLRHRYKRHFNKPGLSLVVVVYRMPKQARKTLYSLSLNYQQDVEAHDYEVIVVENSSDRIMGEDYVKTLRGNFRYFFREESVPTPLPAINYGASLTQGRYIGIMIDGARMVSPRIVKHILMASEICDNAVIAVPGYHIGDQLQQHATSSGYDEARESQLLNSINWPQDGYRLFEISCFSGSCRSGVFLPNAESNCLCMPRSLWNNIGGIDTGFTTPGGGFANLDLYKRACEYPGTTLIVLAGEGTFHQYHGGATTGGKKGQERDELMQAQLDQYKELRGQAFSPPVITPITFGEIRPPAYRFIEASVQTAIRATTSNMN